jgi:hypothetical protein
VVNLCIVNLSIYPGLLVIQYLLKGTGVLGGVLMVLGFELRTSRLLGPLQPLR